VRSCRRRRRPAARCARGRCRHRPRRLLSCAPARRRACVQACTPRPRAPRISRPLQYRHVPPRRARPRIAPAIDCCCLTIRAPLRVSAVMDPPPRASSYLSCWQPCWQLWWQPLGLPPTRDAGGGVVTLALAGQHCSCRERPWRQQAVGSVPGPGRPPLVWGGRHHPPSAANSHPQGRAAGISPPRRNGG
jgi:hypothetical protein